MSFLSFCALVLGPVLFSGVPVAEEMSGAETSVVVVLMPADTSDTLVPRSPEVAFNLSFEHTAVPIGLAIPGYHAGGYWVMPSTALLFYGITFGPCAGHFYADNSGCAGSALLRIGFSAAAIGGIIQGLSVTLSGGGDPELGEALFFGGVIGLGSSMLYSIVRAPVTAKDYNERHGLRLTRAVPVVNPVDRAAGVAVQMRF